MATNVTGATDASACINATVVPASEMPRLLALANTPPDNSSSGGRRLQGAVDPNGPCGVLAAALAELGLVANASTFLAEVRRKLAYKKTCSRFCSCAQGLQPAADRLGLQCCEGTSSCLAPPLGSKVLTSTCLLWHLTSSTAAIDNAAQSACASSQCTYLQVLVSFSSEPSTLLLLAGWQQLLLTKRVPEQSGMQLRWRRLLVGAAVALTARSWSCRET
jgi:hypothetical protein